MSRTSCSPTKHLPSAKPVNRLASGPGRRQRDDFVEEAMNLARPSADQG
jgi:hypothetical protein